ncbi:sporulation membrane protein YtaF [Gorillibacterium massiliense]|uniref:sporulation membrane protein YtaF n=1 Tax=Gorillibacterium massiliense TaxID=1280390 RepID=UPI0004BB698E|nr:sporulation membrane protein YtaF [Gorillibacterium massiliense]
MPFFSLLFLAFAVSLDGFGVGGTYGLRKVKIPLISLVIISLFSGMIILLSMSVGTWLARFVSPVVAKDIGAFILVGIGLWALFHMKLEKEEDANSDADERSGKGSEQSPASVEDVQRAVFSIELKSLGIVIQILRKPTLADVDRSGIITISEAALLGLALSLDAFGAGIGAALIGLPPLLTAPVIAISSGLFISAGLRVGYRYANLAWVRRFSVLPGIMLIAMGLLKLL